MTFWWDLGNLEKIRAANAAYAVLGREKWHGAKRMTRRWERLTTASATREQSYQPMMECAFELVSALFDYRTAKRYLEAMSVLT